MASNANIVLADGQATPLNHTFNPQKVEGPVAFYRNNAAPYAVGRETLRLKLSENGKLRTVEITLVVPKMVVEVINGVSIPKVDSYATWKIQGLVPLSWDAQAIKDSRILSSNALKDAIVVDMADNGNFVV